LNALKVFAALLLLVGLMFCLSIAIGSIYMIGKAGMLAYERPVWDMQEYMVMGVGLYLLTRIIGKLLNGKNSKE